MRKLRLNKKKLIIMVLALIVILGVIVGILVLNRPKKVEKLEEVEPIPEIVVPKVQVVDLDSDTRPIAVMINNNSAVWKYQSGLNDAYMVYELLVEGGITREMALFKDKSLEKIQSIRSSRHYYLDYALENDAIYVHWGWSPQAQSDISSLHINNINGLTYEGVYFFRDKTVNASLEHKGYTSTEYINKAIEKLKYRSTTEEKPLLAYNAESIDLSSIENIEDAKYVSISFSKGYAAKFYYDEETKMYKRSQNSTEMIDYTSGERIVCKNIITYQVGYSNIAGDNKGRLNMNNIGSGNGYFISEGKAVPIKWEKTSRSGKTKYTMEDGSELVVNDGMTYIEIAPTNQNLTISSELPA